MTLILECSDSKVNLPMIKNPVSNVFRGEKMFRPRRGLREIRNDLQNSLITSLAAVMGNGTACEDRLRNEAEEVIYHLKTRDKKFSSQKG